MSSQPVQEDSGIDPKTFRKGDRVWVEGVIDHDYRTTNPATTWVRFFDVDVRLLNNRAIRRHFPQPRPIEVGDKAALRSGVHVTVRAVHKGNAWAEDNIGMITVPLSELERVES